MVHAFNDRQLCVQTDNLLGPALAFRFKGRAVIAHILAEKDGKRRAVVEGGKALIDLFFAVHWVNSGTGRVGTSKRDRSGPSSVVKI